jgi:hypothetical protein
MTIDLKLFGPLAAFVGTWQGSRGDDTAPDDFRGVEKNAFREEIVFTPVAPTANHEQTLYPISYTRTAWRLREEDPFHQQLGYWFWDPAMKLVMHSFMIPRGMTVLAGGDAEPDSSILSVKAARGSSVFGICSNPFLEEEFRTIAYEAQITLHSPQAFSYREDTRIQIKGQDELFHHVDQNTLEKTK